MDAFIIIAHTIGQSFLNRCIKIQEAFRRYGRLFILLESPLDLPIEFRNRFNIVTFNWSSLLSMGYTPIEPSMIPGSNHFTTLWFHLNNPEYRFYWSMEFDVHYTGDWADFFQKAYLLGGDFQSCHIRNFEDDPNWFWWKYFYLPGGTDDLKQRVRSFNPIYRISEKALRCIHKYLGSGIRGHHELIIPTVLKNNGFELIDYGGSGTYVKSGYEEQIYITQHTHHSFGSMSHLPFKNESLALTIPNKLVHPIKYI